MSPRTGPPGGTRDDAAASPAPGIAELARAVAAIGTAIEDRTALEGQLTLALAELVELRAIRVEMISSREALALGEDRFARAQDALQSSEATMRDMSQSLGSVLDERDTLQETLKTVKKKYRRAAMNAEQAKQELSLVERRLGTTEAQLTAIKQGLLFRLSSVFGKGGPLARMSAVRSRKALLAQQMELVRQSHFFDSDWYLAAYPDVADARIDPAVHYVGEGWREGRNPGPEFSSNGYLKANQDIAAAGLNPLVHYIEHGMAEGRPAGDLGPTIRRRSIEDFGPAAPVLSASIEPPSPVRWVRHYQFDESGRPLVRIGNELAGYLPETDVPDANETFMRFWTLSGLQDAPPSIPASVGKPSGAAAATMADSWLIGRLTLRTRWKLADGCEAIVVRGYQRGASEGLPLLMGESVVTTSLDLADFTLANPLLPILLVICRPDGEVIDAVLLAFPSLCRGGLHYAELLVEREQTNLCPLQAGDRCARALEAILAGEEAALVQSIRVDLAGADGTHPMFQSDFQDWLDLVMRVDTASPSAPAGAHHAAAGFLIGRIAPHSKRHAERSSASAQLVLPSDCVPTIGALVSAAGVGDAIEMGESKASLLVVQSDPAKTALAVELPRSNGIPASRLSPAFPLAFPRITGSRALPRHFHAAIRNVGNRQLAESELLQPIAQPLEIFAAPATSRGLIVVVEAALWTVPALEAGLGALRLQQGSDAVQLCLIGTEMADRKAVAEAVFPGRIMTRLDAHAFLDGLGDEDVMHLGPSVILHDNRTLVTFQSLLADASAASASCPIVSCARQGKGWIVAVDDAGAAVASDEPDVPATPLAPYADAFWRSVIPVRAQPRNLWAARADVLRNAPDEATSAHLCCNLVTASYFNGSVDEMATIALPVARAEQALRVEVLVG